MLNLVENTESNFLPAVIASPLAIVDGRNVGNSGESINPRTNRPQGENIHTVSAQWRKRPDNERFTSLTAMQNVKRKLRERSRQGVMVNKQIEAVPCADHKGLVLRNRDSGTTITPTHWAFNQLSALASAPASYMRKLPSELSADCINYGLHVLRDVEEIKLLTREDENGTPYELAAINGPNYGRIWDSEYLNFIIENYGDGVQGKFTVPAIFGKPLEKITKNDTTLFASDSDMFIFLADETNRIEIPNRRDGKSGSLARGFIAWNSEVGGNTIGVAGFLFDYACSNRIIWGVNSFSEIKFRHTSGAPDRWREQILPFLKRYSESPIDPIKARIESAQNKKIDDMESFLARRFSKRQSADIFATFQQEEGRKPESLFDVVTGITALAKFQEDDSRIKLERLAGDMLSMNDKELLYV